MRWALKTSYGYKMSAVAACVGAEAQPAECGVEGLLAGLALAEPDQALAAGSPAPAAAAQAAAGDSAAGAEEAAERPAAAKSGAALEQQMARLALAQAPVAPNQDAGSQNAALHAAQAQPARHEGFGAACEAVAGTEQAEQQPAKPQRHSVVAARASDAAAAASAGDAKPKRPAGARRSSQASAEDADRENRDSSNVRTDAHDAVRKGASKKAAAAHEAEAAPLPVQVRAPKSGVAAMRQFWEATSQKGERSKADRQAMPYAHREGGHAAARSSMQDWSDDD
jgi:hypothetical protein